MFGKKKVTKEEIKLYKKLIKKGRTDYILMYGGRFGFMFAIIMFILDYFMRDIKGIGTYSYYLIFLD